MIFLSEYGLILLNEPNDQVGHLHAVKNKDNLFNADSKQDGQIKDHWRKAQ